MPDVVEATGSALVAAWRRQAEVWQPSGQVAEHDGLVVMATGLPESSLNPGFAAREPVDPREAVLWAEEWRIEHGSPGTGFDLPEGRFPRLEDALRKRGYAEIIRRPMMVLDGVPPAEMPYDVRVVRDATDVAAYVELQVDAFGFPPEVAETFFPPAALLQDPDCFAYLAVHDDKPVACALGLLLGESVGVFGVGTRRDSRRRGYGRAVTTAVLSAAARAGARQAWLQSSPDGLGVYRGMGFWEVCDWVVFEKRR